MKTPAFTALLLAGGKSTRMGRDKAAALLGGIPLWVRQLTLLRQLAPAELLISGKPDGPYAASGIRVIQDAAPARGPLAGVSAALSAMQTDWLLVLAIDLPAISAEFLSSLTLSAAQNQRGIVPISASRLQPLSAIYPRASAPLAQARLTGTDWSMQSFVNDALTAGLIDILHNCGPNLFINLNTPEDLARWPAAPPNP